MLTSQLILTSASAVFLDAYKKQQEEKAKQRQKQQQQQQQQQQQRRRQQQQQQQQWQRQQQQNRRFQKPKVRKQSLLYLCVRRPWRLLYSTLDEY